MDQNSRKQPYHHGGLYEALVAAGSEILAEGDLEKFTLRECARRAGVSHAAPRNHFSSIDVLKSEIGARGFDQLVRELGAAADAAPSQSPEARLVAMGQAYVSFARHSPAVYLMMFRDSRELEATPHYCRAADASWAQINAAVAAVVGPEHQDAQPYAAHAWALVHGFASLIIDGRLSPSLHTDAVITASLVAMARSLRDQPAVT